MSVVDDPTSFLLLVEARGDVGLYVVSESYSRSGVSAVLLMLAQGEEMYIVKDLWAEISGQDEQECVVFCASISRLLPVLHLCSSHCQFA